MQPASHDLDVATSTAAGREEDARQDTCHLPICFDYSDFRLKDSDTLWLLASKLARVSTYYLPNKYTSTHVSIPGLFTLWCALVLSMHARARQLHKRCLCCSMHSL
jgi:hypothetical protein